MGARSTAAQAGLQTARAPVPISPLSEHIWRCARHQDLGRTTIETNAADAERYPASPVIVGDRTDEHATFPRSRPRLFFRSGGTQLGVARPTSRTDPGLREISPRHTCTRLVGCHVVSFRQSTYSEYLHSALRTQSRGLSPREMALELGSTPSHHRTDLLSSTLLRLGDSSTPDRELPRSATTSRCQTLRSR